MEPRLNYQKLAPGAVHILLEMETYLRRSGLDARLVVERIGDDLRVREFLDRPDVRSSIVASLTAQRAMLLRYLEDRGFRGNSRLVVDVGWRGTLRRRVSSIIRTWVPTTSGVSPSASGVHCR